MFVPDICAVMCQDLSMQTADSSWGKIDCLLVSNENQVCYNFNTFLTV